MSDIPNEPQTTEEAEVVADEQAMPETAEEEPAEEQGTDYIEFVGQQPFGTDFTTSHTVTRKQIRDAWDVTTPKDLQWTKKEGGPLAGRMLVPVSDMSPEAAEGLANDPMFKRVTL